MKTFKDYMTEGKKIGILYHYTQCANAISIIQGNEHLQLEPFELGSKNTFISLTRNSDLPNNPFGQFNIKLYNIRFAFDGDKLSDKYKVEPIAGFYDDDTDVFNLDKNHKRVRREWEEQEEIVHAKKKSNGIKSAKLLKYLKEIQVYTHEYERDTKCYETLKLLLKKKGINVPIKLVRKFQILKEDINWKNQYNWYKVYLNEK